MTDAIGVGIISFNRPHLLRRLIASLEQQTVGGAEYTLWQDGAVNPWSDVRYAADETIAACVQAFEASALGGRIVRRDANCGTGLHQRGATDMMAAVYERVLMVEDDVVLSPHWLRLAALLFDDLEARPDLFGFSPGYRKLCGLEEVDDNLARVVYGSPHWWCVGFLSDRWHRIRPHLDGYYALIERRDYRQRDNDTIRALYREKGWDGSATSQDGGKDMAIACEGMRRATLAVNRAIGTGRRGVHFTERRFQALGFDNQRPYVFASDAELEGFAWPT